MRIPFPERVPIDRVIIFVVLLFAVQCMEGTALYFSVGCAAFIFIAALAFNTAGGLTRASGTYVFFYSVLVVIIGVCYKAFLGEPGESNLLDPQTDIKVYVGGITAMFAAAVVSRRVARKSGLLQNVLPESRMYRASIGCMVFGLVGASLLSFLGSSQGSLESAFLQLNQLLPLGIIIGVMHEIRRSGGTRSVNLPILLAIGYYFLFFGILGFSKQGMLLPFVCWLFPVAALRFRLSMLQVMSGLLAAFILFYTLVPFAQYGRSQVEENYGFDQKIAIAIHLLGHPLNTRQKYLVAEAGAAGAAGEYFDTPQGFWDRLQFVSTDDPLVNFTDKSGRTLGLAPVAEAFTNAIPHAIWANKPTPRYGGNYYAHELGTLSDEDTTTGISFSPTAEAFHLAGWIGVLVIAPLLWFLLFVIYDSLFGDLRATPWGLLVTAMISHNAPEAGISGLAYLLSFGTEIIVFCALFATYVAPLVATTVLGRERRILQLPFRGNLAPDETTGAPV